MIQVSGEILERIKASYGEYFAWLSRLEASRLAAGVVDEAKVHEQVALFCAVLGEVPGNFLPGKTLLEIGSGFCVFTAVTRRDYGLESYGVEPAAPGFDSSYAIGRDILKEYGCPPDCVRDARAESLPWPDNSFDLVYSTNVLEHVDDPDQAVREAIRVLKPGGYAQFVYPNYGSFFDGHYALPWIPHMPRVLARMWVRLWGRDPGFVDTLRLLTAKDARRWAAMETVEPIDLGKETFRHRMTSNDFSPWAGLGMVKRWVALCGRLGLARLAAELLIGMNAYTPVIFTFRKK